MNNDAPDTPRRRLLKNIGLSLIATLIVVTYVVVVHKFVEMFQGSSMLFVPVGF